MYALTKGLSADLIDEARRNLAEKNSRRSALNSTISMGTLFGFLSVTYRKEG